MSDARSAKPKRVMVTFRLDDGTGYAIPLTDEMAIRLTQSIRLAARKWPLGAEAFLDTELGPLLEGKLDAMLGKALNAAYTEGKRVAGLRAKPSGRPAGTTKPDDTVSERTLRRR